MAGTHRTLRRGEYRLEVAAGEGPAGLRRAHGPDIHFDIDGGTHAFSVDQPETVYFWWRGRSPRAGVNLARVRPMLTTVEPRTERRRDPVRVSRDGSVTAPHKAAGGGGQVG